MCRRPSQREGGDAKEPVGNISFTTRAGVASFIEQATTIPVTEEQTDLFLDLMNKAHEKSKEERERQQQQLLREETEPKKKQTSAGADEDKEEAGRSGHFELRSAIGLRFQREHARGSEGYEVYSKVGGREAKRAFREQWAKHKYSDYACGKTFTLSYEVMDESIGEHLSLGAIVMRLGGWSWKPAVLGAQKLAARCVALGGRWVKKCDWTGLLLFYYVEKKYMDRFHNAWTEFEAYPDSQKGVGGEGCARAAIKHGSGRPPAPTPALMPPANEAKDDEKPTKKAKHTKTPDDRDLTKLVKEGTKVKAQYQKLQLAATSLISRVDSGEKAWSWADHPESIGNVKKALQTVLENTTTFGCEFLIQDAKGLRDQYGTRFASEMENFVALAGDLAVLQKSTAMILTMHSKRRS